MPINYGLFFLAFVIGMLFPVRESQWTVRQARKIGSLVAPEYSFTRIEGMTENPSGAVFVLQHEEGTIKQYDRQGRFVRRLGK